jgi:hypothetical protein
MFPPKRRPLVSPRISILDLVYHSSHIFDLVVACELAASAKQTASHHGCYILRLVCIEQGRESLYLQSVGCRVCDWGIYRWYFGERVFAENGWHGIHIYGNWRVIPSTGTSYFLCCVGSSHGLLGIVWPISSRRYHREWKRYRYRRCNDCCHDRYYSWTLHEPSYSICVWHSEERCSVFFLIRAGTDLVVSTDFISSQHSCSSIRTRDPQMIHLY